MKAKIRSFVLLFILFFVVLLYFEDTLPVAKFSNVLSQNIKIENIKEYKKIPLIYNIKTEYNGSSLITLKDIIDVSQNEFVFLKNNPLFYEGKYNNTYIYVTDKINCIPVFSVNNLDGRFLNFLRKIKYVVFYPFDKEYAFYEKFKMLDKNSFFTDFNPVADTCFIGNSESYITLKKVQDKDLFYYPDLKLQLNLIKNYVYVPEDDFDKQTFYGKRNLILENLGSSYTSFYYHSDFDFYVVTKDNKTLPLGSAVNLKDSPLIYVKKPVGNYIIAVYKNGQVESYYNTSFILKPLTIGYYFFIVYKYERKLIGGIYTSVEPVLITNPIFIQ
jgi:hypothetical protein